MPRRYAVAGLLRFVEEAPRSRGVPDDGARTAEPMLDADLRGMSGHGIFRLPASVRGPEAGGYNVNPPSGSSGKRR